LEEALNLSSDRLLDGNDDDDDDEMIGAYSLKKLTIESPMRRDPVRDQGERKGSNTEEFKKH
jgi:hypothetical protein